MNIGYYKWGEGRKEGGAGTYEQAISGHARLALGKKGEGGPDTNSILEPAKPEVRELRERR